MIAHAIKHNHKPTTTPQPTVIAATNNHFLPPLEDDNENDAGLAELMGKYDVGGKKKVKGGQHRRYKNDDEIEDLHGLYKELKDDDEKRP